MPIETPFHPRTSQICRSYQWREWSGYLAATSYEPGFEHEYFALRNAAALFDVSPLFKYELSGPQAEDLLNRVMTRDIRRLNPSQVMYTPWCDDQGKLVDDGTVSRLTPDRFRVTAAEPSLRWLQDAGIGLAAQVMDRSEDLAALSLQGPNARRVLLAAGTNIELDRLPYYGLAEGKLAGLDLTLTRTGYSGDLGYELWIEESKALRLWDRLIEVGADYGLTPAGLDALDIGRIEAGFPLIEIDYKSGLHALIEAQQSSPYEMGMGWAVELEKPFFIGQQSLKAEAARAPKWRFVGLLISWPELVDRFADVGLAPQIAGRASRIPTPLYHRERQIGQVTSQTFSPLLKQAIGLASVKAPFSRPGTQLDMEVTVEYQRLRVRATVVRRPFFDPRRKRALGS